MDTDIQSLSFEELENLAGEVQQVLAQRKDQEVRKAKEEILRIAKEHGLKIFFEEMGVMKRGRRTGVGPSKFYVNPENSAETWVGRGKRPKWLKTLVDAGHSVDDYLSC